MPLELSELTQEEALRSYSSVKGHRTRVEKDIGNLLHLLATNYSATSEERINDRLEKLEKQTHKISDIAEYLVSLKYAEAQDHRDEVADFKEVLDKCSDEVFTVLHDCHAAPVAAAPVAAAPLQAAIPPRAPSKPSSSELRPEKLTHDVGMLHSFLSTSSNSLTPHVIVVTLHQSHPEALRRRRSQSTRSFQD